MVFAYVQSGLLPGLENLRNIAPLVAVKSIPTFLSLLIFGFFYQCLLLYDTLAHKNTMQLIGLCFYAICLFIYSAIQWDEIEKTLDVLYATTDRQIFLDASAWWEIKPLLTANACLTAIYVLFISFATCKLYDDFQWKIFKQLNADLEVQRRYFAFKVRGWSDGRTLGPISKRILLTERSDLYHAPQVRCLLLSWILDAIPHYKCDGGRRVGFNDPRRTSYHHYIDGFSVVYETREQASHAFFLL